MCGIATQGEREAMPKSVLADLVERYPWLPYVAPFALFCALTEVQQLAPGSVLWVYPLKTALTGASIVALARWLKAPGEPFAFAAAAVGVAILAMWILSDGLYPLLGTSTVFNPYRELHGLQAYTWIALRLLGAAVVVPIAEEFFWRGFLIRWLVGSDFRAVRMGREAQVACCVSTSDCAPRQKARTAPLGTDSGWHHWRHTAGDGAA